MSCTPQKSVGWAGPSLIAHPLYWLLRTSVQEIGLFCTMERAFLPQLCWLLSTSVGKKIDFPSRSLFLYSTNLDGGTKETGSSRWMARGGFHQARTTETFWQQTLQEARWMQDERSLFKDILTNDDDPLAHPHSLLKGRPSSLLFKPLFGSHGADQPRSERQAPWFLLAQWHERIQKSRESAAGSLDAVVPG